eukprot:366334-Chlamydomonas_euryale.AAC.8
MSPALALISAAVNARKTYAGRLSPQNPEASSGPEGHDSEQLPKSASALLRHSMQLCGRGGGGAVGGSCARQPDTPRWMQDEPGMHSLVETARKREGSMCGALWEGAWIVNTLAGDMGERRAPASWHAWCRKTLQCARRMGMHAAP